MTCPKCGKKIEPQIADVAFDPIYICDNCGFNLADKKDKEVICCQINCSQKAKYQIGDKDKHESETTFVCEEHKNFFAYDWIEDYNQEKPQ